jgi:pilus assembly protein CpaB
MARGQMVTPQTVVVQQWPKELIPPGALSALESAVDRSVMAPILPGEPMLEGKLASRDSGRGLAALVPQGMRAYTIQTSRTASNVAGFILPRNRVDLLTLRGGSGLDRWGQFHDALQPSSPAVDQRWMRGREPGPQTAGFVTLLVSPDHAALLDLGQNMGQLTLSLRNPDWRRRSHGLPRWTC